MFQAEQGNNDRGGSQNSWYGSSKSVATGAKKRAEDGGEQRGPTGRTAWTENR